MPISEDEIRNPRFIKYQDRYPLSYDKTERYTATVVNPKVFVGRSNSIDGTGWKLPGYNPHHNSINTERLNLSTDSPTLKPY